MKVRSKSFENDALSAGTSFEVDFSEKSPPAIVVTPSQDEIRQKECSTFPDNTIDLIHHPNHAFKNNH